MVIIVFLSDYFFGRYQLLKTCMVFIFDEICSPVLLLVTIQEAFVTESILMFTCSDWKCYEEFFCNHKGGATSKFMLIQGAVCWVSVCSRPLFTYAVNVRIFKVLVLMLSMHTLHRLYLGLVSHHNDDGSKMVEAGSNPRPLGHEARIAPMMSWMALFAFLSDYYCGRYLSLSVPG